MEANVNGKSDAWLSNIDVVPKAVDPLTVFV